VPKWFYLLRRELFDVKFSIFPLCLGPYRNRNSVDSRPWSSSRKGESFQFWDINLATWVILGKSSISVVGLVGVVVKWTLELTRWQNPQASHPLSGADLFSRTCQVYLIVSGWPYLRYVFTDVMRGKSKSDRRDYLELWQNTKSFLKRDPTIIRWLKTQIAELVLKSGFWIEVSTQVMLSWGSSAQVTVPREIWTEQAWPDLSNNRTKCGR
jgi:hypothetical protein